MATNPARFDLRSMSSLQKELHAPVRGDDGEYIGTPFASLFQPTLRNSSLRVNLTRVASNKSSVDYILDSNVDYLLYTYLDQDVPALRVRPEYEGKVEIAWTHYLGANLFRTASLRHSDIQPNTLTPTAMYFWFLFLIQQKRLQALLTQIGHTAELTTWASTLPSARLFVPLPWYYASHPSMAFPFFLLREKREFFHQFDFVELKELLRMRVRTEGSDDWKDVPYDPKYLQLPSDFDGRLPMPELYGRAVMLEDDERTTMRCKKEVVFYYDTFQFFESTQETEEGRQGTLSLDCEAPCKAFAFGCASVQSKKTNQHQNWLAPDGERPVMSYKVLYGNSERVPATELEHLEMDMWEILPPNFEPAGLAVHLGDIAPMGLQACSGVVYSPDQKANLCVRLRAPVDEQSPVSYKLQALLWTTRKLVFRKDEKDELVYNLSVHPDPITE